MRPCLLILFSLLLLTSDIKPQSQNWNITSLKEYIDIRLEAIDKAVTKAEAATEKRFEGVNEFRNTLADQQRTFMPRAEAESQYNSLSERISAIETKMEKIEGSKSGGSTVYAYLTAIISTIIAIVSFGIMIYRTVICRSK